jgi:tetratricopeptide (TPR) repeat protein
MFYVREREFQCQYTSNLGKESAVGFQARSFPTVAEVEEQFERIKFSRRFRRASSSLKLLKFLVDVSLSNETSTEREVGVKVYGRDENWEIADDTIVRQGRFNLQTYLAEYYVLEGGDDMVIIETPNGHLYHALFRHNPASMATKRCNEGLKATRRIFLGCGGQKARRPEDYFNEVLGANPNNAMAASGKGEAILTRALFSGEVGHLVKAAGKEVGWLGTEVKPWRGEVVRGCIAGCEIDWTKAKACLAEAYAQISLKAMDDVWSTLLILSMIEGDVDPDLGSQRMAGKDGLEETQVGFVRYMRGRFEEAWDDLLHAEQVSKGADIENVMARFLRGCICLATGKAGEAEKLFRSCLDKWDIRGFLAVALVDGGKKAEAHKMAECVKDRSNISDFQKGLVEMAIGDESEAVKLLRRAYAEGDPWMWFARLWPVLDPLRKNQDFLKLVEEVEAAKK